MKFNGRKVQKRDFVFTIHDKYDINKCISGALNQLNEEEKEKNNKEVDIMNIMTNIFVDETTYKHIANTISTYLSIYIIYSVESEKEEL